MPDVAAAVKKFLVAITATAINAKSVVLRIATPVAITRAIRKPKRITLVTITKPIKTKRLTRRSKNKKAAVSLRVNVVVVAVVAAVVAVHKTAPKSCKTRTRANKTKGNKIRANRVKHRKRLASQKLLLNSPRKWITAKPRTAERKTLAKPIKVVASQQKKPAQIKQRLIKANLLLHAINNAQQKLVRLSLPLHSKTPNAANRSPIKPLADL